jgi:hypothetical protein
MRPEQLTCEAAICNRQNGGPREALRWHGPGHCKSELETDAILQSTAGELSEQLCRHAHNVFDAAALERFGPKFC